MSPAPGVRIDGPDEAPEIMTEAAGLMPAVFMRSYPGTLLVTVFALGDDLLVLMTGGDRPHIGAAALASGEMKPAALCFPGHKDDIPAERIVRELSSVTSCRVAAVCGVHYDHFDGEVLKTFNASLDRAAAELKEFVVSLERYQSGRE